ncbi:MAG: tetratricopeptide repeat protein [Pseudomonadota bacterium]
MKNLLRIAMISLMATGSISSFSITSSATAALQTDREVENERRSKLTVTSRTGIALTDAINLYNSDPPQLQAAINKLGEILSRDLNKYDESTALEIRGQLYYQVENVQASIRDFNRVLQIDELPYERLQRIRFNLAQIYFQEGQYDRTISFMRQYMADDPSARQDTNALYILAVAYSQQEDFRNARQPAEDALRYAEKQQKKNYDLLNLIYSELGLTREREGLLERMVQAFPNEKPYWIQLAGIYSILENEADAFSTLEIAYNLGFLDTEQRIVALAQFYSRFDNPYRGGQLIEKEMAAGRVEKSLKNLELLSQLWSMAREQRKAIASLTEAARLSDSGELYYRLGQSYVADEQFAKGIENLRQALRKGGLSGKDRGDINLLIGNALFSLDGESSEGRAAARRAYVAASNISTSRNAANSWIKYIDELEATDRALAEVERLQQEARRQQEIDRCETLIDVVELGGSVDQVSEQRCRELLARVESGEEVELEAGTETDAAPAEEETSSEG